MDEVWLCKNISYDTFTLYLCVSVTQWYYSTLAYKQWYYSTLAYKEVFKFDNFHKFIFS